MYMAIKWLTFMFFIQMAILANDSLASWFFADAIEDRKWLESRA